MTRFNTVFDQFVQSYIEASNASNQGLLTYFDKDWFSPCLMKDEDVLINNSINLTHDNLVTWAPFSRGGEENLANIERALEISIPAELHYLFCGYYSHDLSAEAADGSLTILQAWNEHDFERLQKNLIAHVLMKRRLKQADTLFFALTDEDEIILSVELDSGAVVAERVGKKPHKQIANNLSEFIGSLKPVPVLVEL